MPDSVSDHYDDKYFDWQAAVGEFSGWVDQVKFRGLIPSGSRVLDFGCGGGYILKGIDCRKKVGVEVNPAAAEIARENGIEVYHSVDEVPDEYVDIIISHHALEHTLYPLQEIQALYKKLVPGGKVIFYVPCESVGIHYKPGDISHHLYSWSPMCLGNLFTEAGYSVIESRPYLYKWPRKYRWVVKITGRRFFPLACRLYGWLSRSMSQARVIAEKADAKQSQENPV